MSVFKCCPFIDVTENFLVKGVFLYFEEELTCVTAIIMYSLIKGKSPIILLEVCFLKLFVVYANIAFLPMT